MPVRLRRRAISRVALGRRRGPQDRDVWLYYVDRQALLPRTHVFDGLEGAFDVDRAGWAPPGSALARGGSPPASRTPRPPAARQRAVRLSFDPSRRASSVPGRDSPPGAARTVADLRAPRPASASVPCPPFEFLPDRTSAQRRLAVPGVRPARDRPTRGPSEPAGRPVASAGPGEVRYELEDAAHGAPRVPGSTRDGRRPRRAPPRLAGLFDRPGPLLRANGRSRALPDPGGGEVLTLRYEPAWRISALVACAPGRCRRLGLGRRPDPGAVAGVSP